MTETHYEVKMKGKNPIMIKSKFVRCVDGIYIFYNKVDQDDIDQPEAIIKQNIVTKITKKSGEK